MNSVIEEIKKKKLIAILRGVRSEKIAETVSALLKGGINIVEITFDQSGKIPLEDTAAAIKKVASTFGDVFVGAGTVMTKENLELAAVILMTLGAIGTGAMPKEYFGIPERFSVFAAAGFNAILGIWLFRGKLCEK